MEVSDPELRGWLADLPFSDFKDMVLDVLDDMADENRICAYDVYRLCEALNKFANNSWDPPSGDDLETQLSKSNVGPTSTKVVVDKPTATSSSITVSREPHQDKVSAWLRGAEDIEVAIGDAIVSGDAVVYRQYDDSNEAQGAKDKAEKLGWICNTSVVDGPKFCLSVRGWK